MSDRNFRKKVEDFTCDNCGTHVKGTGYTDHCPNCLVGKHVDNSPGDRESGCKGRMEPIDFEYDKFGFTIIYKCNKCSIIKRIKAGPNDNVELLMSKKKDLA